MKFTLYEKRSAVSFPAVIDIVFYKDEKEALYRLKYIDDATVRNAVETLHHIMCLSKYAPDVIEGEVIFENKNELRIVDKNNNRVVYHIQKNAEKFKFLDAARTFNKTYNNLFKRH